MTTKRIITKRDIDNFASMILRKAQYNSKINKLVKPFKDDMDEFIRSLKSTEPAAGQKRVLVPGEPEAEEEVERLARGIPLHRDVVKTLRRLCLEYQVECEI